MAVRRARLGLVNALAWVAFGLAATALATDALSRDGGSLMLALGTAGAIAGAALGLLTPAIASIRTRLLLAGSLVLLACAAGSALARLQQPPHFAVVVALGVAVGVHTSAIRAATAADASFAPRVRPAPTLLAAAVGASLTAAAEVLPLDATGITLLLAAGLQPAVLALSSRVVTGTGTAEPVAAAPSAAATVDHVGTGDSKPSHARIRAAAPHSVDLSPAHVPGAGAPHRAPIAPPALLALLAVAAAGVGALVALRPGLSMIGATDASPAGPIPITIAIGALLGPPLAMLADRIGAAAAATLAVVAGCASLIAPIARPGVLDVIAAVVLGVALAAVVALAELARRAEQRLATGATALVVLSGAAGAGLAALLLTAVPLPDVVLVAAMACLVAGVGMWAPGVGALRPVG